MVRAYVLAIAACVFPIGGGTADEKAKPRGPAPRLMVLTDVSREGIALRERTPGRDNADLYRERVYELGFADFRPLDAAGKDLTPEQFRKRVAGEPVVLVFAEKVEPAYCRVVKAETVVLVVKRGKLEPTVESEWIKNKVVPEPPPAKPPRR